jgi:hypothetical protein
MATYPDLSCATLLLVHILNPDIFLAIVSGCAHTVGVFVPPVLALESVWFSLSRLTTVLTKALSMADILSI